MKIVLALLALVAVVAAERAFLERDSALPLPSDWVLTRRTPNLRETRQVHFAVKIAKPDELEARFWADALPESPLYRQHLNIEELAELTSNPRGVAAVRRFLARFGVHDSTVALTGDWVVADVPKFVMQKMFNVTFKVYQHVPTRQFHTCTLDAYSAPAHIAQHLDFVSHIVGLPQITVRQARSAHAANHKRAGDDITPSVIRARYNVSESITCHNGNNSHAVAEFQDQNFSPNDLATSSRTTSPTLPLAPMLLPRSLEATTPTIPVPRLSWMSSTSWVSPPT